MYVPYALVTVGLRVVVFLGVRVFNITDDDLTFKFLFKPFDEPPATNAERNKNTSSPIITATTASATAPTGLSVAVKLIPSTAKFFIGLNNVFRNSANLQIRSNIEDANSRDEDQIQLGGLYNDLSEVTMPSIRNNSIIPNPATIQRQSNMGDAFRTGSNHSSQLAYHSQSNIEDANSRDEDQIQLGGLYNDLPVVPMPIQRQSNVGDAFSTGYDQKEFTRD